MNKWIESISETIRPESFRLNFSYPDIMDLLPVAIICGISILLAGLWLLAILEYTWLKCRYLPQSRNGHKA
jgi:hypothetical protein